MSDFIPADAAGVVISKDAYGKHSVSRIFIRDGKIELEAVSEGRAFGSASRLAANEMELLAHDVPRGKVVLQAPAASTRKVYG